MRSAIIRNTEKTAQVRASGSTKVDAYSEGFLFVMPRCSEQEYEKDEPSEQKTLSICNWR